MTISLKLTFEERRYIFVALRFCSSRAPQLHGEPNYSEIHERCTCLAMAEMLDKIDAFQLMKPNEILKLKFTRSKWAAVYSSLDFIWHAREHKSETEIMFLRSLLGRIYPIISNNQIFA